MSAVSTPRPCRTAYSSSPKSSPTGPTTRTSQKKLAASEKCTAEPPSIRSRSPKGVLTASKAIDPTTARLMRRMSLHIAILPAMRKLIPALAAGAALIATAPAASAATAFNLGTGSHPDVAVDTTGTAHIVVDLPDERLRYCQVPRGQTACAVEQTLTPPAEAIGRSSYIFVPASGRVVIVTHRCCSPDATLAYQSTDNG